MNPVTFDLQTNQFVEKIESFILTQFVNTTSLVINAIIWSIKLRLDTKGINRGDQVNF